MKKYHSFISSLRHYTKILELESATRKVNHNL